MVRATNDESGSDGLIVIGRQGVPDDAVAEFGRRAVALVTTNHFASTVLAIRRLRKRCDDRTCGNGRASSQAATRISRLCSVAIFAAVGAALGVGKPAVYRRAMAIFCGAVLALFAAGGGNALAGGCTVSVTSISPNSGPATGGTSVMITGMNFIIVTSVQFGSTATSFTVNGGTSITATAPAGSGEVDVTVTSALCGTSPTSPADQFTYTATTAPSTTNSQYVRALQLALTKAVATVSGQVITDAVDAAIGDAFATTGSAPIIVGPNGLFFNFAADPQRDAAAAKAIDALAYSGDGIPKGPLFTPRVAPDWNAWADLRGTGFDLPSSDETGHQVNLTLGVSRKLGEDLLVGFFTGYETIDYTVASLNAQMSGNGGTIGSYAAWRFMPHWRLDGMAGWSDIFYNASAGTASGDFTGSRWLGSAGLTGTYVLSGVNFEPSTHIYSLYESENAWTDSLGTLQAARDFSESRVSAGGKISTPWQVSDIKLSPYAGFYGDYRFSSDNALPVAASVVGISDGWSGRATGGVTFISRNGASLSLGGEYGGIGAGYEIWSGNVRVNVPF